MTTNRDRRTGAVIAILFSAAFWFLLLHLVSCETTEPTLLGRLNAADQQRDLLHAATLLMQQPQVARATLAGEDAVLDARVLTVQPPCGSGVRPYLWVGGKPVLGSTLAITADPYGAPRPEGDSYDWPFVFVLVEFQHLLAQPFTLPSGCSLWIDPDSSSSLVWSLGGRGGYHDPLLHVDPDGRLIRLQQVLPELESFAGRKAWTQMVVVDGSEWKTSQTIELVFGHRLLR